jgi:hypothetical protein
MFILSFLGLRWARPKENTMTIAEPVRAPLEDARVNYVYRHRRRFSVGQLRRCHRTCGDLHRAHLARLFGGEGLYLILVAIAAFGAGGYLAGRMRRPVPANPDEVEFRDGTLGLIAWAIAVILTALTAWAAAQSLSRLGAPSSATQSVAGENLIAYDLDRLFRAERRPQNTDLGYARSEAGRILLTSAGHTGVTADDRNYLVTLTSTETGLARPDAERRVDTIITQARDDIRKARRAAVILAFMAGAAALLGAAVAWFASCADGRHRNGTAPSMTWGWLGPHIAR